MSNSASNSYLLGPSKAVKSESDSNSQTTEELKMDLKTALVYCEHLLLKHKKIALEPYAVIEEKHMRIGEKLYGAIMDTLEQHMIVTEDLIMFDEPNEGGLFEEIEDSRAESDDEYHPDEKKSKIDKDFIPLDYKIKVVNMAKEHPKWSLRTLQKNGGSCLRRMDQLKIWEEQIRKGGSTQDKYTVIDTWTYDRFVEARQSNQQVTRRNLQQWALAAAKQFPDLKFKAADSWIDTFKRRHQIRQRKVTKFVSEEETAATEKTLPATIEHPS